MIKLTKQEAPKYDNTNTPKINENRELVAELVKTEELKSKDHPDWKPAIKFIFRVLEEPYVGAFASGLAPSIWQPGTKLDRWLTALGVTSANFGDEFSLDELKKQTARIIVKMKNGYATIVDIEAMTERDRLRISPDAGKRSDNRPQQAPLNQASTATAPAGAPVISTGGPTSIAATPAPQQGQVTKDDSIPF